MILHNFA